MGGIALYMWRRRKERQDEELIAMAVMARM